MSGRSKEEDLAGLVPAQLVADRRRYSHRERAVRLGGAHELEIAQFGRVYRRQVFVRSTV